MYTTFPPVSFPVVPDVFPEALAYLPKLGWLGTS